MLPLRDQQACFTHFTQHAQCARFSGSFETSLSYRAFVRNRMKQSILNLRGDGIAEYNAALWFLASMARMFDTPILVTLVCAISGGIPASYCEGV